MNERPLNTPPLPSAVEEVGRQQRPVGIRPNDGWKLRISECVGADIDLVKGDIMLGAAIALMAATISGHATQVNPCAGSSTPDMEACAEQKLDVANAELIRYTAAARRRAQEVASNRYANADEAAALTGFDAATQAWEAYRDAECQAATSEFAGGTISGYEGTICRVRITRLRTRDVWQDWLVNLDGSTVLPEPSLPNVSR